MSPALRRSALCTTTERAPASTRTALPRQVRGQDEVARGSRRGPWSSATTACQCARSPSRDIGGHERRRSRAPRWDQSSRHRGSRFPPSTGRPVRRPWSRTCQRRRGVRPHARTTPGSAPRATFARSRSVVGPAIVLLPRPLMRSQRARSAHDEGMARQRPASRRAFVLVSAGVGGMIRTRRPRACCGRSCRWRGEQPGEGRYARRPSQRTVTPSSSATRNSGSPVSTGQSSTDAAAAAKASA